jgi:hypothetical protein
MDDEDLVRENESLTQQLLVLGHDPAVFADLLPDELNLRLKKAIACAEEAREAELLGREPPPAFLDPTSPLKRSIAGCDRSAPVAGQSRLPSARAGVQDFTPRGLMAFSAACCASKQKSSRYASASGLIARDKLL